MNVMAALPSKYKPTAILISTLVTLGLLLFLKGTTSATAIAVSSGTDTIAVDSICHLSEAIQNINDQAQTNADCVAGDGSNDTITLPSGTITLSDDLPYLTKSITIQGQGMGESIVDGDEQYTVFWTTPYSTPSIGITIQDVTVAGFSEIGIGISGDTNTVRRVEVDGTNAVKNDSVFGPGTNILCGIFMAGPGAGTDSATIDGVYIHDLNASNAVALRGINIYGLDSEITNTTLADIDVSDTTSSVGILLGPSLPGQPGGAVENEINNITIDNMSGNNTQLVSAVATEAYASSQDATITTTIANSTFNDLSATGSNDFLEIFFSQAIAANGSVDSISNFVFHNNVIANGGGVGCAFSDITSQNGGSGTPVLNTTSEGGNISDTNGCSSWLNAANDFNSNSSLNSKLGALGSYGGSVPTIKLLPGSPAIDNISCTGAPSIDARGVTRPQGTKCDSGAYEVSQAAKTTTSPISNPSAVNINVPAGTIVESFSTQASSGVSVDNQGNAEYEYPLGLTSFELGVPSGSTQDISLDFETSLNPEEVVARKYNSNTQEFSDLEGATIESITINDAQGLRVSYSITDGVFPDMDGQANGTIVDPIGLAVEKQGVLANTGDNLIIVSTVFGFIMIIGALYTYVDYRKHKKPLANMDPILAKQYTFWHHLNVVTVPLTKYRLQIIVEKKNEVPVSTGTQ